MFLAWGKLVKGWALVSQGEIDAGIALSSQGIDEWRASGTLLASSWCLGILAEGNKKAGRPDESLALLTEALEFASRSGEHFFEAELHRLRGELLQHEDYVRAGANVIETNTFGANRIKLGSFGLAERLHAINEQGAKIARHAAREQAYVAGAIGPLGIRIEPWGKTGVDEAREYFREQAQALATRRACGDSDRRGALPDLPSLEWRSRQSGSRRRALYRREPYGAACLVTPRHPDRQCQRADPPRQRPAGASEQLAHAIHPDGVHLRELEPGRQYPHTPRLSRWTRRARPAA
jgi:hypothetical protein